MSRVFKPRRDEGFRRGSRGQSAVETMFMIPILLLVFMGMYELFTITFAAQNAHIRAREWVLHNGAYTQGWPSGEPVDKSFPGGRPLFDGTNYIVADPGIWGVSSAISSGGAGANKGWRAAAHDRGIPGVVTSGLDSGTKLTAYAYICSPVGCP